MVYFFVGCALLVALVFLGRMIVRANPQRLAGTMRKVGAVALFAFAGFLALRGALPLAVPLAAFAMSLIAGGRGLGHFKENGFQGGVHVTNSREHLKECAEKMLGKTLVTKQTGEAGKPNNFLMLAEKLEKQI